MLGPGARAMRALAVRGPRGALRSQIKHCAGLRQMWGPRYNNLTLFHGKQEGTPNPKGGVGRGEARLG